MLFTMRTIKRISRKVGSSLQLWPADIAITDSMQLPEATLALKPRKIPQVCLRKGVAFLPVKNLL